MKRGSKRYFNGYGEEWLYWITADDAMTALPLTVGTKIHPHGIRTLPYGVSLSLHVGFPNQDDVIGGSCKVFGLSSGRCYGCLDVPTAAIGAQKFWEIHGRSTFEFEQDEAFWKALELEFTKWDVEARRQAFVDEPVLTHDTSNLNPTFGVNDRWVWGPAGERWCSDAKDRRDDAEALNSIRRLVRIKGTCVAADLDALKSQVFFSFLDGDPDWLFYLPPRWPADKFDVVGYCSGATIFSTTPEDVATALRQIAAQVPSLACVVHVGDIASDRDPAGTHCVASVRCSPKPTGRLGSVLEDIGVIERVTIESPHTETLARPNRVHRPGPTSDRVHQAVHQEARRLCDRKTATIQFEVPANSSIRSWHGLRLNGQGVVPDIVTLLDSNKVVIRDVTVEGLTIINPTNEHVSCWVRCDRITAP